MKTVKEMIADIIRREGGYVDHPNDHGGATNYGVSLRYVKGVGIRPSMDLDGDGDVDAADTLDLDHNGYIDWHDIALVTPQLAARLYEIDFYERPGFNRLPEQLQPIMFDMAVNHGPGKSGMILQRALIGLGYLPAFNEQGRRQDDGVLGPMSRKAVAAAVEQEGWKAVVNMTVDARRMEYEAIIAKDPSQGVFRQGWMNRAEEFRVR